MQHAYRRANCLRCGHDFERLGAARICARCVAEAARFSGLTLREWQCIELVAQGAKNKEIAATLYIVEGTVKQHLTAAYIKIDVSDRLNAALWWLRVGEKLARSEKPAA